MRMLDSCCTVTQVESERVVASTRAATSVWARTFGWPMATKLTLWGGTPLAARTRVERAWSWLPARAMANDLPVSSDTDAMLLRATIMKKLRPLDELMVRIP